LTRKQETISGRYKSKPIYVENNFYRREKSGFKNNKSIEKLTISKTAKLIAFSETFTF
jgi:hypothetical protein